MTKTMARPLQDHSRRLRRRGSPSVRCASREVNFKISFLKMKKSLARQKASRAARRKASRGEEVGSISSSSSAAASHRGAVLTTSSCSQRHAANNQGLHIENLLLAGVCVGRIPANGQSENPNGLGPSEEGRHRVGGFLLSQFMEMKPTSQLKWSQTARLCIGVFYSGRTRDWGGPGIGTGCTAMSSSRGQRASSADEEERTASRMIIEWRILKRGVYSSSTDDGEERTASRTRPRDARHGVA